MCHVHQVVYMYSSLRLHLRAIFLSNRTISYGELEILHFEDLGLKQNFLDK